MNEGQDRSKQRAGSELNETFRELADQLQDLGAKLANSFRVAWSEERPSEQEQKGIQNELRAAAERLERVVRRVVDETQEERTRTVGVTRQAGERSASEARLAAIQGLRAINEQLDLLRQRLERDVEDAAAPRTEQRPADKSEEQEPRRYSAL